MCEYNLGQTGFYGHERFPSGLGYKRTLSRRNLLLWNQRLYDALKSKGFSVEIVNVNAQYRNSYLYAMIISW